MPYTIEHKNIKIHPAVSELLRTVTHFIWLILYVYYIQYCYVNIMRKDKHYKLHNSRSLFATIINSVLYK